MQFVAALDRVPGMRGILCLFEGVCSGAADGYARMLRRPACTLLHLGPGMANGLANLHNARRGRTPMVNVVGDHARSHKRLDAPLESDIDAVAGTVSGWVRRSLSPADVAADTLLRAIRGADKAAIAGVRLFDRFEAPDGLSLAYEVTLQPTEKSFTDAAIAAVSNRIVEAAVKLGARLRS